VLVIMVYPDGIAYNGTNPPGSPPLTANIKFSVVQQVPFEYAIWQMNALKPHGEVVKLLNQGAQPMESKGFGIVGEGMERQVGPFTETVTKVEYFPGKSWRNVYQVDQIAMPLSCCILGYYGDLNIEKVGEKQTKLSYEGHMDHAPCCPCLPGVLQRKAQADLFDAMEKKFEEKESVWLDMLKKFQIGF